MLILTMTNFYWYSTPEAMNHTAKNMVAIGAENFGSAMIIEKLELLQSALAVQNKANRNPKEFTEFVFPFMFEKHADLMKICLFFENYMKAVLLRNGFLIHKINKEKGCDLLATKQNKEPVEAVELHKWMPFDCQNENVLYHIALSNQTLPISQLLMKEKYQQIIQLPDPIRKIVYSLSERRNELHFISSVEFELSHRYLDELEQLKKFVMSFFPPIRK